MNYRSNENIFDRQIERKMKTSFKFKIIFTLASALIIIYACDDTLNINDIDSRIIPPSNVSYSQHIQPVLDLKCSSAGCHNSKDKAGKLSFSSYSDTVSDPLVVFPYNPQNSKLVWAIEGRNISPMPPVGYPPLTKNQIEGIKTWIKEGAKNN